MSLDAIYKAMADPTRREILNLLREGPLTAGDIADRFTLAKPSISHHLAQLKEAGLVSGVRRGTTITYHLNMSVFEDLVSAIVAMWKGPADGPPTP